MHGSIGESSLRHRVVVPHQTCLEGSFSSNGPDEESFLEDVRD